MKRTMTLNLTTKEMDALELLAKEKGITKTQLIKQALRLYQAVAVPVERGDKLYTEGEKKAEILIL